MTIHFHSKHFKNFGLSIGDYMFLLLFEQKSSWSPKDIAEILGCTERSFYRTRDRLISLGYLRERLPPKSRFKEYVVTDKMYPPSDKLTKIPTTVKV